MSQPELLASTKTSDVFKVSFKNTNAVLKLLNSEGRASEAKGSLVLRCFDGNGAAQLLNSDPGAHLLEYVEGPTLKSLVLSGQDSEATEIICAIVKRIHSYDGEPPEGLVSLNEHFRSLFNRAFLEEADSIYAEGAEVAEYLLRSEKDAKVLHGDIHHENILHSVQRGWLAIDPKYIFGERTYDLANTFYNPMNYAEKNASLEVINRRADILSKNLNLDRQRILQFAFVYGCLSAAWFLEDHESPADALKIAAGIRGLLRN